MESVPSHRARIATAVAYAKEQRQARTGREMARGPPPPGPPKPLRVPQPKPRATHGRPARSVSQVAPQSQRLSPLKGRGAEASRGESQRGVDRAIHDLRHDLTKNAPKQNAGGAAASGAAAGGGYAGGPAFGGDSFGPGPGFSGASALLQTRDMQIRNARHLATKEAADREAQRASVQSRAPSWWPRELKPVPRRRPQASPGMQEAAEARLQQIRAKLEAGYGLTEEEEGDATAILELRQMWMEAAADQEDEARRPPRSSAVPPAPKLSFASVMAAEASGQQAASLLTWA